MIEDRVREQALTWVVRRHNEAFDEAAERELQAWLAFDPRHGQAFAEGLATWQGLDRLPAADRARWQAPLAQAPLPTPSPAFLGASLPTRRRVLAPALATVAAAAVGGWWAWPRERGQPGFAQDWTTQRGQLADVLLPDGSRLRLDTATRVAVRYTTGRREVHLSEGQAMFTVQANAQAPFDVWAGPLRVTVVGTRFAVRYTPGQAGNDRARVAVEEGRVRVQRSQPDGLGAGLPQAVVELTAGQQIDCDTGGTLSVVGTVPAGGAAPWQSHRVRFENLRLDQALAELERYQDTGLAASNPAVAALRISGVFDPTDLATFRRVLPQSLPVRLVERGPQTEIVPAS